MSTHGPFAGLSASMGPPPSSEKLYFGTGDFTVRAFPERAVIDEIRMVMTAFDCIVGDGAAIYCSTETTTGFRLYRELFERHGVRSNDELSKKLGDALYREEKARLMADNIRHGGEFAASLRRRGLANVIDPGRFFAPGFTQEHYLYLWEWVLVKKVREAHFNAHWEYSDGCTLECAIALEKGIATFDAHGRPLDRSEAARLIERAISELHALGFAVPGLDLHLMLVQS